MRSWFVLLVLSLIPISVRADVLFYNGDPDGIGAAFNHQNSGGRFYRLANFDVPSGQQWSLDGAFATISTPGGLTGNAFFEIRTNMNNGIGGTLLASGTLPSMVVPVAKNSVNFIAPSELRVSFGTPIVLGGGTTYWVGLFPEATNFNQFIGRADSNSVNRPALNNAWESANGVFSSGGDRYSLGVTGSITVIPEPTTFSLLAAAAGLIAARRQFPHRNLHRRD